MDTTTEEQVCFFCGDTTPNHKHYTVMCYENGKCVGRLAPDGYAVTRKLFAAMLRKERAEEIAAEINETTESTGFSAKAKPF